MGHSKSSSKTEGYCNTILLQERRKISNKQHNIKPKATKEKNKQNPWLVERKKS